jgi:hypothetical protein
VQLRRLQILKFLVWWWRKLPSSTYVSCGLNGHVLEEDTRENLHHHGRKPLSGHKPQSDGLLLLFTDNASGDLELKSKIVSFYTHKSPITLTIYLLTHSSICMFSTREWFKRTESSSCLLHRILPFVSFLGG